ncbi:succinyl-diaminopimelate desuccinylase [Alicycliphilus sp. B1]|nr:succinyl-diaminopimelate desuccinylase [Alicycliphilus sp. B1]
MPSPTLLLTEQLIARPSVTPEDAGCLDLLAEAPCAPGLRLRGGWTAARPPSASATYGRKGL